MYSLKLHKNITLDKWKAHPKAQQILMIANELNRAGNFIQNKRYDSANFCYERAFELIDLTSSDLKWRSSRELRRFRELLGELYLENEKNLEMNHQLYIGLLRLSPEAYRMLYPVVGK